MKFRPDLRQDDLQVFLDRLRSVMPTDLWAVIEPYTLLPRAWDAQTYGVAEPMDRSTGPWICEVNAPIKWHDVLATLPHVQLANTRPSIGDLRTAWAMIRDAGAAPTFAVNLGPAAETGMWQLEVVAVVAAGRMDQATALLIADVLGGRLCGTFTVPECLLWRTCR
ncbi:hypothetical protein [Nocardia brasiliensis]|uniref:hypothetical protein n=1 Tax=Nocardia brasiliensis TaxID=37326 RepID=UPI00366AC702